MGRFWGSLSKKMLDYFDFEIITANLLCEYVCHANLCVLVVYSCIYLQFIYFCKTNQFPCTVKNLKVILILQPERIDPQGVPSGYDIRSDVWSLGISMVEIATGKFPYKSWGTPFDQLKQVVMDAPPRLPAGTFSPDFDNFIEQV